MVLYPKYQMFIGKEWFNCKDLVKTFLSFLSLASSCRKVWWHSWSGILLKASVAYCSTLVFPWLHSLSFRASYSRTIVQLPLQLGHMHLLQLEPLLCAKWLSFFVSLIENTAHVFTPRLFFFLFLLRSTMLLTFYILETNFKC